MAASKNRVMQIKKAHPKVDLCLLLTLRGAIPTDDACLRCGSLHKAEAPEVIPGDPALTPEVGRNCAAHFFGNHDALGDGVVAEEVGPIRQAVDERRFRDVGLFHEANRFVAPHLTVENHLETSIDV